MKTQKEEDEDLPKDPEQLATESIDLFIDAQETLTDAFLKKTCHIFLQQMF
jgi:hypothetical protein